ncbi:MULTISPECIES: hypothetical protein [unclassified Enterococcus]|uniref:DUF7006 family protein n=1 Tax=unclassified Enterococcus TaxID=2608891 RepID=UPI001556FB07|nr:MULTISPECIES: hypothetical protein [unclassified Enterococcus]MBS7577967.1 hypothetical protein [Enterococcus sp. MMGLQ5-2]MBS7585172.1 hypothetical protein [Enterococcus sp. MMGLQ5-1]NPD13029.1 hypothetical protein [Enterococcus sp. MMGLQ5-1]NPD37797.1 hypothetical protein [Enterococcus sp. MMGLQ5-2]
MKTYKNIKEYKNSFQKTSKMVELGEQIELINFYERLLLQLDSYIQQINSDNFWQILPYILGLDSKFVLLEFYIETELEEDYNPKEIIKNIEKDYELLNQEYCGYFINEKPHSSIIFKIK